MCKCHIRCNTFLAATLSIHVAFAAFWFAFDTRTPTSCKYKENIIIHVSNCSTHTIIMMLSFLSTSKHLLPLIQRPSQRPLFLHSRPSQHSPPPTHNISPGTGQHLSSSFLQMSLTTENRRNKIKVSITWSIP